MANVVGSLIVKMVAQTAEFQAGMRKNVEEATRSSAKIEAAIAGIGNSFKHTMGALGIGLGAHQAISYLHGLVEEGANISKQADKLNMTAEAYQRIAKAAKEGGVETETVTKAMQRMSAKIGAGTGPWADLGLDSASLRGMTQVDAFKTVAEAIKEIPNPMERARLEMEAFGRSGMELDAFLRELDKQGGWQVISDEQSEKMREFHEIIEHIQQLGKVTVANALTDMERELARGGDALIWLTTLGQGPQPGRDLLERQEAERKARQEEIAETNQANQLAAIQQAQQDALNKKLWDEYDIRKRLSDLMNETVTNRREAIREIGRGLMERFDTGYAYQTEIERIQKAAAAGGITRDVYNQAMQAAQDTALRSVATAQVAAGLPQGPEMLSETASRAIAEFQAGTKNDDQSDREKQMIEELKRIREAVEEKQKVNVAALP
jgi:hypothetical protein